MLRVHKKGVTARVPAAYPTSVVTMDTGEEEEEEEDRDEVEFSIAQSSRATRCCVDKPVGTPGGLASQGATRHKFEN